MLENGFCVSSCGRGAFGEKEYQTFGICLVRFCGCTVTARGGGAGGVNVRTAACGPAVGDVSCALGLEGVTVVWSMRLAMVQEWF
jgi:hypothetical protein